MKIDPDAAGLDAGRLERITDHVNRRYIEPGKIAGCQITVARDDSVAYFRSFGLMDLEQQKPVGEDTIWRIYSMTKPITGVALMTLYEEGHFQLGDPVDRFIPEWKDLKVSERQEDGSKRLVDPRRPMTVRDALMHMTGIGYGIDPEEVRLLGPLDRLTRFRRTTPTLEDMVEKLADQPLRFHPGEQWFYSLSTDVCARLVEVISGQRFDEFLHERIFGPLGMADTGFWVPQDNADRFAASYGRRRDKTLRRIEESGESPYLTPPTFLSGGGGLVSTSHDYLRFCRMLLNGGELDGIRVLGRKTVELMTLNHLPDDGELRDFVAPGSYGETGFDGVGFGLTMAIGLGPTAMQTIGSPGEYYWGGAASTIFWVDPTEDLIVLFMTQLIPSGTFNFRGQLKTLVYPAIVD